MSEDTSATQLLEWKSTKGNKRCLLLVTDNEKSPKDVGYKKLQLCTMGEKKWQTDEELDYIENITNVGVPEAFGN